MSPRIIPTIYNDLQVYSSRSWTFVDDDSLMKDSRGMRHARSAGRLNTSISAPWCAPVLPTAWSGPRPPTRSLTRHFSIGLGTCTQARIRQIDRPQLLGLFQFDKIPDRGRWPPTVQKGHLLMSVYTSWSPKGVRRSTAASRWADQAPPSRETFKDQLGYTCFSISICSVFAAVNVRKFLGFKSPISWSK